MIAFVAFGKLLQTCPRTFPFDLSAVLFPVIRKLIHHELLPSLSTVMVDLIWDKAEVSITTRGYYSLDIVEMTTRFPPSV